MSATTPTTLGGGDLSVYHGVAGVTAAYFVVYKSFLGLQVNARTKQQSTGSAFSRFSYVGKPWWQLADRTVANTIEQAIPFLGGMWTHAIFVDPHVTAALGGIYVATRFIYPLLWASGRKFTGLVAFSTIPGYMVSGGFTASILLKVLFGVDLVASLSGWGLPVKVLTIMGVGLATSMLAFFGLGGALAKVTSSQFPDETGGGKKF